ncbi:hypothetical protein B296_00011793 [Ensete ventricosum]|uniref:Uncharacterized protein n=1 Tax=Ensete ventricosum TaxID=4639 RepID=A0A426ZTG3_ENSVE|nr:hypothetical protein B296_00011793 [Ensete ventricosum]
MNSILNLFAETASTASRLIPSVDSAPSALGCASVRRRKSVLSTRPSYHPRFRGHKSLSAGWERFRRFWAL